MSRKYIIAVLAYLMVGTSAFADLPFRNHRYDAINVMPVHQGDIVFVGNSITNMHEWWEAFGCRQDILNRGVSGCVSQETLENIDHVVAGHPSKVFLMVGTNDLGNTSADVPDEVIGNIEKIVAKFKADSPETELYIQSILPVAETNPRVPEHIIRLNSMFQDLCAREGTTYIDLWSKFVEPGTTHINPAYTKDGLHLYPSGYKVWCEEIARYVGADSVYPDSDFNDCGLPSSYGMRAAAFDQLPLDEDDIVLIGDEMIHGGEWHELLGSPRVKNRGTGWGFGGPSIEEICKHIPAIFSSEKSPEQIYLHAAAAEIAKGLPVDTIEVRYRKLVSEIMGKAPGSKLALMSVHPLYSTHQNIDKHFELNERIKSIAEDNHADYVDIFTPLYDPDTHRGNKRYINGNYLYGNGYVMVSRVLAEHMGLECVPVMRVERETAFTGRGNLAERLLTLCVSPAGKDRIRKIKVSLDADATDVSRLSIITDGEKIGSVKVKPGKSTYKIPCRSEVEDLAFFDVCADISDNATEGGKVAADIVGVKYNGKWQAVTAPAPDYREILLKRVKVLGPGYYGSAGYRIPAIITLEDGTLLIATDKRKYNDSDLPEDIDIIAQHSTDGGRTWSDPVTVIEGKGFNKGYGDAALVQASSGDILCAFSGGVGLWASTLENPQRNYVSCSHDGGLTWSEPFDCTSMLWGPDAVNPECRDHHSAFFGSGRGLRLERGEHAGRLLFVAAVHSRKLGRFDNYAFYSDDNGATWHISERAFIGGDEAKVVELPDGKVMMSVRRRGERGYNISEDGGHTWGEQGLWKDICVNACDGDIINVGDSLLLHSVPNSMSRENVSVFVSRDNGQTWPLVKSLCKYESVYSSMTILPDGTIGAYIEENPRVEFDMYFLNFSIDWLTK